MLRITANINERTATLKLEGKLTGPWVGELERAWQEVRAQEPATIQVDLCGVTSIDDSGKRLLRAMHQQGASLRSSGCFTAYVVEEIERETTSHS